MNYVDSQLLPNENVLHRTKLHWKVYILPGLVSVLFLVSSWVPFRAGHVGLGIFFLILSGLLLLPPFLKRANSEFAVTNRRIIIKVGVMTTKTLELLLPKVESIGVNQVLMGKMLGYGDLIVTGSGGTREVFLGVQSPLDLRRAVQAATTHTV